MKALVVWMVLGAACALGCEDSDGLDEAREMGQKQPPYSPEWDAVADAMKEGGGPE